jgi:hypothetical protein
MDDHADPVCVVSLGYVLMYGVLVGEGLNWRRFFGREKNPKPDGSIWM